MWHFYAIGQTTLCDFVPVYLKYICNIYTQCTYIRIILRKICKCAVVG